MAKRKIIKRSEWGAAPPRGAMSSQVGIHTRCLHHTAYPALSPNASRAEEEARMRTIQQGHFSRAFSDIGYAAVVFPSGRIYEGRDPSRVGAGVYGHNTGVIHIAADGNYDLSVPTQDLIKGCRRAFKKLPGSKTPLKGHRDLAPSACPGKNLYARLADMR